MRYQPRHSQIDVPSTADGRQEERNRQAEGPPAARVCRPRSGGDRGDAADDRDDPPGVRALRVRSGRDPAIEYTDALGKFLPDQDRPNEGVFSFQDDDEQWLSLRYDLTAPLARYVAENFDILPKPYRSYRVGWVFRNEKPGPGRFRQFMQFDADTVGSASPAADAEMCMMAADTMEALGVPRSAYIVKLSNRKVLDGLLEVIGLNGENNASRRLVVLRAMDKFDRLGETGVRQLLAEGRKDKSGDFTKGAELDRTAVDTVMRVFEQAADAGDKIAQINIRLEGSEVGREGLSELEKISSLVSACGYSDGQIMIDPSVVRGLEYYTGAVFEVELTFSTDSKDGSPALRFGRRRRALRRAGVALSRRAGAGDGVLHRRVAACGGAAAPRQARQQAGARPGRRHRVRPGTHRRLSAHGEEAPRRRHQGGALSGKFRLQRADEIRRQARRALRHHPGLRREGQRRSHDQGPHPRR